MIELLLAAALLFATHYGISSTALRDRLIARFGERLYLVLYTGAKLHYYEAHHDNAEKIIQSIRMK